MPFRHLSALLLLLVATLTGFTQEPPPPALVCPQPRHDLGRIQRGAKLTHVFRLENRGAAPVTIREVRPACDCTTAPLTLTRLAPGQGVDLPVTFDSAKFEGPVEKTVTVLSDDARRPSLRLDLLATVEDRWKVTPASLSLGVLSRFRPAEARLWVTRTDGRPAAVRSLKVLDQPRLRATLGSAQPRKGVPVVVNMPAGLPAGPLQARLLLALEDEENTLREVAIQGQVADEVTAHPSELDLGGVQAGSEGGSALRIALNHPGLQVRRVTVEPAWLAAQVVPRSPLPGLAALPGATVLFRVSRDAPSGPFQGRIRVRTSSPHQPELQVPVRGTVVVPGP